MSMLKTGISGRELANGEIQTWRRQGERKRKPGTMKPVALGEQVKSGGGVHQVVGGGMRGRSCDVNRGDLAARRRCQESEGS
jgi:hypothetical protein